MSLSALERFDTHNGDAVTELLMNVALGQVPGAESIYIFGHNPSIPLGTTGMLWPLDNSFTATGLYQANAVPCYISSSSALDTAITLKVTVIDTNWDRQYYGVILNGQNPIALPINVRRVLFIENTSNKAHIGGVYAGTSAAPVGGVQLLANTMNYVDPEDQISHTAFFTVPRGKVLLVYKFAGGTPTNDSMTLSGYFSNPTTNVFKNGSHLSVYRSYQSQDIGFFPLQEKTDIYLAARAYSNNTEAYGQLLGVLVDKKYYLSQQ